LSDGLLASENLIQALRAARDNDRISAIVLRIDSPGGSVLAADEIWQEIREIRKDKPVFASMSDVAASGGYYIAIACDTIIAHPATLTGSIGVISAIPNFSGLLAQMDITVDTVKTSRSAVFLDPFLPFAERDRQKFSNAARETYFRFVERPPTPAGCPSSKRGIWQKVESGLAKMPMKTAWLIHWEVYGQRSNLPKII
jgi:protease-4